MTNQVVILNDRGRAISSVEGPAVQTFDGSESFEQFSHSAGGSSLISQGQSRRSPTKSNTDRAEDVARARTFWREDGPSKQIVRLYRSMAIGKGMGAASTLDDESQQEEINKRIHELFTGRSNRSSLSSKGQQSLANKLLVDGELFLVLFLGNRNEATKVRTIDSLEIMDLVTEKEDAATTICYKRESILRSGKTEKRIYFDAFANEDRIEEVLEIATSSDATGKNPFKDFSVVDPSEVRIIHVTIETLTQRGNSILLACMYPAQAHRDFKTARNATIKALATIAWDEKIKGGSAAVASRISALGSSITQNHPWESNPPPVAGSTLVHNEGVERTPVKQDTQANNARVDNEIGLQSVGIGAGVYAEFLGAANTVRLANGLAEITTMAEAISEFQECFADTISDAVSVDLVAFGKTIEVAKSIIIIKKQIIKKDKEKEVNLLLSSLEKAPILLQSDSIMLSLFEALEISDPKKALEELRGIVPADENELSENIGANTVKILTEMKARMAGKFGERNLTILTDAIENQHKDGDACCE